VAIALLVPAAAVADLRGARSPWRHPLLVRLGEMSYSFYLVHLVTIVAVVTLIGHGGTWPLPLAVGLGLALLGLSYGIAAALFTWVEMPALRAFRRPARRHILSHSAAIDEGLRVRAGSASAQQQASQ
jgi:peptidoglycan/LPS O-acetylase OafA/YrhL